MEEAKSANLAGNEILGPALLNRARNLDNLKCYKQAIADALQAAAIYDKTGQAASIADKRNRAVAYQIAGDSATASAIAFTIGGNDAGAEKLFEESDSFFSDAIKIFRESGVKDIDPEITNIMMLQIEMLKRFKTVLTQNNHLEKATAISSKLETLSNELLKLRNRRPLLDGGS